MKKAVFISTIIALVMGLSSLVIATEQGPAEIQYTPKIGTVTFDHNSHQGLTDCISCHHTGDNTSCTSCHGSVAEAPKTKDAFHGLCKDCHSEMKQGPTKCKECHIK